MKIIGYAILCMTLCIGYANAQTFQPVEDPNTIEKYEVLLKKQYPHMHQRIVVTNVQKINDRFALITYENGSHEFDALVNNQKEDMLLVATYHKIEKQDVPRIVKDNVKEEMTGSEKAMAYFEVMELETSTYYAVEVASNDDKSRLHFTSHGRIKESPY